MFFLGFPTGFRLQVVLVVSNQHVERICNTAHHLTHRSHSETEAWQHNTPRGCLTLPFSSGGFLLLQKSEFSARKDVTHELTTLHMLSCASLDRTSI